MAFSRAVNFPIIGLWSVENVAERDPGFLFIENEQLYLTIYIEISHRSKASFREEIENHPRLAAFGPGRRFVVRGATETNGCVTLFECMQSRYTTTDRVEPPQTTVSLTLFVSEAWAGADFVDRAGRYNTISFEASGLHNILSTLRIDHKWLAASTPQRKSDTHDLKVLTDADQAWLLFAGREPCVEIEYFGRAYKVGFFTWTSHGGSSTGGVRFGTTDGVYVEAANSTIAQLNAVAYQVQQFLSILCIGPFRGNNPEIALDPVHRVNLLWSLARKAASETMTRMPHQILVELGRNPEVAEKALKAWFGANSARRLARWLVVDAIFKQSMSVPKFLAVAQAWEVIGREATIESQKNKENFRRACDEASIALNRHLDPDLAARMTELLRTSNRRTFGDLVRAVLDKIPELARRRLCGDVDEFVASFVRARNALTHMEERKNLSIEAASRVAFFLTYKLIVLFCINECAEIGLPLDNLESMLANNEAARDALHPLPT